MKISIENIEDIDLDKVYLAIWAWSQVTRPQCPLALRQLASLTSVKKNDWPFILLNHNFMRGF